MPVILDVTLRRDEAVRRWTISTAFPDDWTCQIVRGHSVDVSACATEDQVVDRQREWRAEIAAARADGWA